MLEVVDEAVGERCLVERRDVPRHEDGHPDDVADPRAEEEAERRAEGAHPGQGRQQVSWQEEHDQRPADGEQDQDDAEIRDQHVLEHVHGLQVGLPDVIDGRDDREHGDEHARDEERES